MRARGEVCWRGGFFGGPEPTLTIISVIVVQVARVAAHGSCRSSQECEQGGGERESGRVVQHGVGGALAVVDRTSQPQFTTERHNGESTGWIVPIDWTRGPVQLDHRTGVPYHPKNETDVEATSVQRLSAIQGEGESSIGSKNGCGS